MLRAGGVMDATRGVCGDGIRAARAWPKLVRLRGTAGVVDVSGGAKARTGAGLVGAVTPGSTMGAACRRGDFAARLVVAALTVLVAILGRGLGLGAVRTVRAEASLFLPVSSTRREVVVPPAFFASLEAVASVCAVAGDAVPDIALREETTGVLRRALSRFVPVAVSSAAIRPFSLAMRLVVSVVEAISSGGGTGIGMPFSCFGVSAAASEAAGLTFTPDAGAMTGGGGGKGRCPAVAVRSSPAFPGVSGCLLPCSGPSEGGGGRGGGKGGAPSSRAPCPLPGCSPDGWGWRASSVMMRS